MNKTYRRIMNDLLKPYTTTTDVSPECLQRNCLERKAQFGYSPETAEFMAPFTLRIKLVPAGSMPALKRGYCYEPLFNSKEAKHDFVLSFQKHQQMTEYIKSHADNWWLHAEGYSTLAYVELS